MIKTAAFALTAALLSVAPQVSAEPVKTAPEPATEQAAAATPATRAAKPTRYCIIDTVTGSIIRVKTCHSREEWLAQGFDPLAK